MLLKPFILSTKTSNKAPSTTFHSAHSQMTASRAGSVASDVPSIKSNLTKASSAVTTLNKKAAIGLSASLRFDSPINPSTLSTLPSVDSDASAKVSAWLKDNGNAGAPPAPAPSRPAPKSTLKKLAKKAQAALIKSVRTPGQWAGNLELVAMARSLGVTLHIIDKSPSAQRYGDTNVGKKLVTLNAGTGKNVYIAYDGSHYDALLNTQAVGKDEFESTLAPMPGDGDCAYHAVATGAVRSAQALPGMYNLGTLNLRMQNPVWQGVFAGENISQEDAYAVMRQAYALQLRYDTANELKKSLYAEPAYLQQISGF